jgi:hypothetical protein
MTAHTQDRMGRSQEGASPMVQQSMQQGVFNFRNGLQILVDATWPAMIPLLLAGGISLVFRAVSK